jgi:hypothetical protein
MTVAALLFLSASNGANIAAETAVQRGGDEDSASPTKTIILSDDSQPFSFTLDSWDYAIIECDYADAHSEETFTYKLSFSVSEGSLEFFLCSHSMARQWELGGMIIINDDDHWGSTNGVTIVRTLNTNAGLSFVFNHEHSGSRTVQGSVVVDTSPPSISCSLTHNATYNETVTISATATDTVSDVDSVWLYIDGDVVEQASGASLSHEWDTTDLSNGNHTIVVDALDEAGYYDYVIYEVWVDNQYPGFSPGGLLVVGIAGAIAVPAVAAFWFLSKRRKAVPSIPISE